MVRKLSALNCCVMLGILTKDLHIVFSSVLLDNGEFMAESQSSNDGHEYYVSQFNGYNTAPSLAKLGARVVFGVTFSCVA